MYDNIINSGVPLSNDDTIMIRKIFCLWEKADTPAPPLGGEGDWEEEGGWGGEGEDWDNLFISFLFFLCFIVLLL